MLIGASNRSEVGVITVPLHGIAPVAKCLKIPDLVSAAPVSRGYVVYFQSALVCRYTAKFAMELGALENVVA
jgi:hypothetical protein